MAGGYKWIKIYGTPNVTGNGIVVAEMEILNSVGMKLSVDGTPFGSPPTHSTYGPEKAFDGEMSSRYNSQVTTTSPAYLGYHKAERMAAAVVRLGASSYPENILTNGVVLASNDSTDGFDGTWDTLATGVTMASTNGTWTSHPLTWGPNAYKELKLVIPTPIILATMPASLTRGFR